MLFYECYSYFTAISVPNTYCVHFDKDIAQVLCNLSLSRNCTYKKYCDVQNYFIVYYFDLSGRFKIELWYQNKKDT